MPTLYVDKQELDLLAQVLRESRRSSPFRRSLLSRVERLWEQEGARQAAPRTLRFVVRLAHGRPGYDVIDRDNNAVHAFRRTHGEALERATELNRRANGS